MTDWIAEPREVLPELAPNFDHATFPAPATVFPPITERWNTATPEQLLALAKAIV